MPTMVNYELYLCLKLNFATIAEYKGLYIEVKAVGLKLNFKQVKLVGSFPVPRYSVLLDLKWNIMSGLSCVL